MLSGVDPEAFYEAGMQNPVWEPAYTGESFAWHARFPMDAFLEAYRASGERAWLEYGFRYYENIVDRLQEGPDGYKGWIGPYIYDNSVWCDVHVGDAILFDALLRFSELVLVDEPELADEYGAAAERYVSLAREHLFEKWETRATFIKDGPFGAYVSWNRYGDPGNLEEWTERPEIRNSDLSLPLNKNMDMASVALRIHRIIGDPWYRERAEMIHGYVKSRIQRHGESYVWNYWEPFWERDFDPDTPGGLRHWVQVHPYRNYQAGEVGKIVQAYHHGIVYTEADIRAILHTNLGIMWNGDMEDPEFANSNLEVDPGQTRDREDDGRGLAGTLWTGLADFSETVRELQRVRGGEPVSDRARISRAYRDIVSHRRPASFERRHASAGVAIPEPYAQLPMGDVASVRMAIVLPMEIERGTESTVIGKLNQNVELEVALYDGAGSRKLATLFSGAVDGDTGGRSGFHRLAFDGIHPETGEAIAAGSYRVRWTVPGDGYREYPVTIRK